MNNGHMKVVKIRKAKATEAQAKKRSPAKAGKSKGSAKRSKLSVLDPAAKVLGVTRTAMNCKALIEAMAAKGYWKSPGGQTPWSTLYAAIIKEIATKGKESRRRADGRGLHPVGRGSRGRLGWLCADRSSLES